MITGFNTDIEYKGTTYHVQTEDKGLDTPLILSLVYNRGTILASKRSPYNDLLLEKFDEKILSDRLQKQHKLICAAIRAGRIEDLKRMTMKDSASRKKGLVAQKEILPIVEETPQKNQKTEPKIQIPEKIVQELKKVEEIKEEKVDEIPIPNILTDNPQNEVKSEILEKIKETPVPQILPLIEKTELPKDDKIWEVPINIVEEYIIDEVEVIEETILPAEAVAVITDFAKSESTITDELKIELLNEKSFKGGERTTMNILVTRGNDEKSITNANVMIKILGSSFRPLIFHARTDSNGVAIVHLQFPHFKTGRAAVLIKAISGTDEIEIRRVIAQG